MSSLRVQAPLRGNVASRSASRPAARGCRRSLVVRAEAPAEKWPVMQSLLKQAAVPSVGVASVAEAQADGYVLVDVRPAEDFEQYHAPGAVSVPLFTPIKVRGDVHASCRRLTHSHTHLAWLTPVPGADRQP